MQALVASAAGIEAASNSAAVASRCRVVITMLPDSRHVRAAVEALVEAGLAKGAIVDRHEFVLPARYPRARQGLAKPASAWSMRRSPAAYRKAVSGTLAIMAGGETD